MPFHFMYLWNVIHSLTLNDPGILRTDYDILLFYYTDEGDVLILT